MKKICSIAAAALVVHLFVLGNAAFATIIVYQDPTAGDTNQNAQESAFLADVGGGLTHINFDALANGTVVAGTEWSGSGVLFSDPLTTGVLKAIDIGAGAHSPSNMLINTNGQDRGDLLVDFITVVHSASLWIVHSEATSVNETLVVKGTDDSVLFSGALPAFGSFTTTTDKNFFFGIVSTDVAIASIQITEDSSDVDGVGIEDVMFGAAVPIPEPGTLVLMGLGSLGLIRKTRRKRQ